MNDWKNETCKDCYFRIDTECRRFPPVDTIPDKHVYDLTNYPKVGNYDETKPYFQDACSEYKNN